MNVVDWRDKMHEALDAGGAAADAPEVAAHLARHPEDRALCEQFDRLEGTLRSRRAPAGGTPPADVARVMGAVRRHELSERTGRLVIAAAAAAVLVAVILPLVRLRDGGVGLPPDEQFADRFEGYVDPREDPLTQAQFILAVVQERSEEGELPVAFGQIVVQSDGGETATFFKGGRRVDPEVLADELVKGRLQMSDPQDVFDAVARTSEAIP